MNGLQPTTPTDRVQDRHDVKPVTSEIRSTVLCERSREVKEAQEVFEAQRTAVQALITCDSILVGIMREVLQSSGNTEAVNDFERMIA